MTGLTRDQEGAIRAMAERGISDSFICSVFEITPKRLRHVLDQRPEPRLPAVSDHGDGDAFEQHERDVEFVELLLSDGGLPRAEIIGGRTYWLGPDGRPWQGVRR